MTQVAIDGPASSGKSSVGTLVAATLGYGFLDTGLLYRALTRVALDAGLTLLTAEGGVTLSEADRQQAVALAHLTDVDLESGGATIIVDGRHFEARQLEGADVERAVATIAAIAEVRTALRVSQREIAMRGSVVLAGRDIGTVVYPESQYKFFLDASTETRALRRALQRGAREGSAEHQAALRDLVARDQEDRNREVAPLRAAEDAELIMSDALSLAQVVAHIVSKVHH